MSPVISKRTLKAVLDFCESGGRNGVQVSIASIHEMRRALKPKKSVKASRVRRETKRLTKREETAEIRKAVMRRAEFQCECCGAVATSLMPLELDHFWGRGKAQQTECNCWALCHHCHHDKTNNAPSAAHWLREFAMHAQKYGLSVERQTAIRRLAFVETRGALSRQEARDV